MLAAMTQRSEMPRTLDDLPAASSTFRDAGPPPMPREEPTLKKPLGSTQVRTLDTGRPPPPDATPTREEKKL
jgi:hypothetical protein